MGARIARANLVVHHGIIGVFNKATKIIHILNVFKKPLNLALLYQWR